MGYREIPPHPSLLERVKCFWSIEEEPTGRVQEIWPDGCVELYFSSGSITRIDEDGAAEPFPGFGILGLQTGIMRVRCESTIRIISASSASSPGNSASHQSELLN